MDFSFQFLAFSVFLALTPTQRWQAARRFNPDFMAERWFTITAVVVIIILAVLFFIANYNRKARERRASDKLFSEYAEKRGLSDRERQILLDMASNAGFKRNESIFTLSSAFDRVAAEMIEETLAQQGLEESKQLRIELSLLREKLGFRKQHPASIALMIRLKKLSSRQIPVGKKLNLTGRKIHNSSGIEATIIKNDDMELTLKLTTPQQSIHGESWRVRYYLGASVWEFDASVISCDGNILVLNHSDRMRPINRRRFLRVPVSKPAFIARFPFAKVLSLDGDSGKEDLVAEQNSAEVSCDTLRPPEFVSAVVTELAGPGLRIETTLEVEVGERVLVVLRLDEETAIPEMIEDVGEVRHVRVVQNGLSIAVELTGLSDSDVNELIRITNAASVRTSAESRDIQGSTGNKQVQIQHSASGSGPDLRNNANGNPNQRQGPENRVQGSVVVHGV